MATHSVNVLFTSAGRRVELLRAFRRAYDSLGLIGRVVAIDVNPLAPALQVADRSYVVPRLADPGYVDALVRVCEREEVSLVFPLIDPDIPMLARHRARLEALGAEVAVPDLAAAETAADKWATVEFFTRIGVPTPRSWLPGDAAKAIETVGFPLFIKPRRGSASVGAFRVDDETQLRFFAGYLRDPIIQELLPGPEVTTDVVCATDGTVLGLCSRQRLESRGGEVAKGVTVHDDAILEQCERIARALPASGPITVQCIMRGSEPCFTEINARFGGGLPLGIAAGVDAPALLLAHRRGDRVEPVRTYRIGLHVSRFDDAFFLGPAERARVEGRRA